MANRHLIYRTYVPPTMPAILLPGPIEEMTAAEIQVELRRIMTIWNTAMDNEDATFLANARRRNWWGGYDKEMYIAHLRGDIYLMDVIVTRDQRDTTTKQNTKFPTLTATDIKTRDSRMLAILLDIPDTAKAAFLSYDFHPQLRNRLFRLPPTPPKYHAPVAAADLLPVEYVLALCRPNGSNPTMSEMTAICDDVEKYCQLIQRPARGARLQMRALNAGEVDFVIRMESVPRESKVHSLTRLKHAQLVATNSSHSPRWPDPQHGEWSTVEQALDVVRVVRQRLATLTASGWQLNSNTPLQFTTLSAGYTNQGAKRFYEYTRPQGINGALKIFNAAGKRHNISMIDTWTVVSTPWDPELVPMGEHILTVLCQGYAPQGGLNVTAGGVQTSSINKILPNTWTALKRKIRNSQHYVPQYNTALIQVTTTKENLQRAKDLTALRKRLIQLKKDQSDQIKQEDLTITKHKDSKKELDELLDETLKSLMATNQRLVYLRRVRNRLIDSEIEIMKTFKRNGYVLSANKSYEAPGTASSSRQATPGLGGQTATNMDDLTKGLERIIELDAETEEEDVVPSIENQGVSGGADDAIDLTGDDD